MNAKMIMLAVAVVVIGAAALMMCDDSEAAAGDVLATGSCGTQATYTVTSLNADDSLVELHISGTGRMYGYSNQQSVPWMSSYRTNISSVTIDNGITNIGSYSFAGTTKITELLNLPNTLTEIGSSAFLSTPLASITIPDNVSSIGEKAFSGCTSLALTSLPAGLTSLGVSAFSGCTSLALTSLPDGLTSIGDNAFIGCTSLALTSLPDGLTSIGETVFNGCPITTMKMPSIGNNLGLTKLTSLTYTTTKDGGWSNYGKSYSPQFQSSSTLETITFAQDQIPANALYGQNLGTLTITNASGPDVLGIYTAPNVKATASALTVDGTAAHIVRLTDVRGAAELVDGGITANDAVVSWTTTPDGYATGPVNASPEVLVYPAGIHTSAPNQYAGLINAIPLIVIVAIITTIIGMMAVRRD